MPAKMTLRKRIKEMQFQIKLLGNMLSLYEENT